MSCDVGEVLESLKNQNKLWRSSAHSPSFLSLHLHHSSFSNPSVALPKSQVILQSFRCFTYITAHSTTLSLLHLRHSSFYNPSFASPTSQALHLRYLASCPCGVEYTVEKSENEQNSFSKLSVTSPASQLILQTFHCFTYITAHSPSLPLLHLCHSSYSNPSFASPTSQALHLHHLASRSWEEYSH